MASNRIPKYFRNWFDKIEASICPCDIKESTSAEYNKALMIAWEAYKKGKEDEKKRRDRA